jgi:DNA polymerase-4
MSVVKPTGHRATPPNLQDQGVRRGRHAGRRVAANVHNDGRPVARVAVKVRFALFVTQTRSHTLDSPSVDTAVIEAAALEVLEHFERDRPVQLLGVRGEFVSG